jgi:hypothetical protein
MPIELSTRIVRVEDLMTAPADRDLVILNLVGNNYVALNDVGRRIWELLQAPRRVDELCQQLSREFGAVPEQIAADVLPFLNELQSEHLLHVVDERSA